MNPAWMPWLTAIAIGFGGALLASAFWWWLAPTSLVRRWAKPLQDAMEEGFAEQALQQRLRSQADKVWARKQQGQWRENQDAVFARHEASLLAEMRLLSRPAVSVPAAHPAPAPASPVSVAAPARPGGQAAADMTDAQLDALPPEVPLTVRRRVLPAGKPPLNSL